MFQKWGFKHGALLEKTKRSADHVISSFLPGQQISEKYTSYILYLISISILYYIYYIKAILYTSYNILNILEKYIY